jgi:hypothetical protein
VKAFEFSALISFGPLPDSLYEFPEPILYSSFRSRDSFFEVKARFDFGFACQRFALCLRSCCMCAGFDFHFVGFCVAAGFVAGVQQQNPPFAGWS